MNDSSASFIDVPEYWFPMEITWTDTDTGEIVRKIYMETPGVLTDGGFGQGRRLKMVINLGNGESMTEILRPKNQD